MSENIMKMQTPKNMALSTEFELTKAALLALWQATG
jgi:hypothetical protein